MINRCIFIVRPKKPFFEWLEGLPDPVILTPETFSKDSTAYLIPEYDSDEEIDAILENIYELIFQQTLWEWWIFVDDWPKKRDFSTFKEWFDFEFHTLVLDLVDEPLEVEDF